MAQATASPERPSRSSRLPFLDLAPSLTHTRQPVQMFPGKPKYTAFDSIDIPTSRSSARSLRTGGSGLAGGGLEAEPRTCERARELLVDDH